MDYAGKIDMETAITATFFREGLIGSSCSKDASAVLVTNWPSSSGRGDYFSSKVALH